MLFERPVASERLVQVMVEQTAGGVGALADDLVEIAEELSLGGGRLGLGVGLDWRGIWRGRRGLGGGPGEQIELPRILSFCSELGPGGLCVAMRSTFPLRWPRVEPFEARRFAPTV